MNHDKLKGTLALPKLNAPHSSLALHICTFNISFHNIRCLFCFQFLLVHQQNSQWSPIPNKQFYAMPRQFVVACIACAWPMNRALISGSGCDEPPQRGQSNPYTTCRNDNVTRNVAWAGDPTKIYYSIKLLTTVCQPHTTSSYLKWR